MQILVINAGSSSLKYRLLDTADDTTLASGNIEQIGVQGGGFNNHQSAGKTHHIKRIVADHEAAFQLLIDSFAKYGPTLDQVSAVGHRVVHGGTDFTAPTRIDDAVERRIEQLAILAPLHNPANLCGIRAARSVFDQVPHVAVFDTAFHQTLSPASYTYAIDRDLAARHAIRHYGFHGISYTYISARAAELLGRPLQDLNIIALHLGSGASAAAIAGGKSVETSMGLTPLEGLVMSTRSGDIDPGIISYLHQTAGMNFDEIDNLLNKQSGFYGLSGYGDMRDILEAAAGGEEQSRLTIEVYCRRVKKYIGAYTALLPRVDALVMTGGIGERSDRIRQGITDGLGHLGIRLDATKNQGEVKEPRLISADTSPVAVIVIPTDEEIEIARETADLINA